ncbi:Histone deacetylase protein [Heracleum sosnowskyi]|uniref:Histone deacetylase protein n=1 Tax=Heracleum sosnowskyi TaxID=360622 RepID=A0AAD8N3K2_9APIA|nr:Histone deacetylase protein [Heracleum sosnowskyi]
MASVSSSCCMSMKPPPSSSSSSSSPSCFRQSTQVSWPRKEGSWRRHLVVGMACMIITLQNGELNLAPINEHSNVANAEYVVVESKKGSLQWSNQRQCQPWRINSLETIVPENLPRPSAHRRWEKVNHSKESAASAVKMLTNIDNKCFTM